MVNNLNIKKLVVQHSRSHANVFIIVNDLHMPMSILLMILLMYHNFVCLITALCKILHISYN